MVPSLQSSVAGFWYLTLPASRDLRGGGGGGLPTAAAVISAAGRPAAARNAVMGGAQLDLTALPPARGGVDVVVRTLMGGVAVRIPKGWTTWWSYRGAMGGVGADAGVRRVDDPAAADLRVRAGAVMGGVGIETAER